MKRNIIEKCTQEIFENIQSNSNHTRPVLIFQFFSAYPYVSYAYSSDRISLIELENQNG